MEKKVHRKLIALQEIFDDEQNSRWLNHSIFYFKSYRL